MRSGTYRDRAILRMPIMDIKALEAEVEKLSDYDFAAFRDWFARYDAARDVGAGRDVKRDSAVFTELVTSQVARPLAPYGFVQFQSRYLDPGMWVTIRNATTEISVYFEYASGVHLSIRELDPRTTAYTGHNFGLDDLLWIRPRARPRPARPKEFHPEIIRSFLQEESTNLLENADDVLRGDFTVYTLLEPILLERRRRYEREDFEKA